MQIESGKQVGKNLVEAIFRASKYAYVCSPYISREYAHKLVALSRTGTSVKVLTSSQMVDGNFFIRSYFFDEREKDGLPNLRHLVLNAKRNGLFHAKLYVVDDAYAVGGSANLTEPGMRDNSEIMFIAETANEIAQLRAMFEKFWQQAIVSIGRYERIA